ncbi:KEOPS complex component [Natrarchaeobius halalkaliphilus]|uniref:KEOPS complex component n=1 Tax=Natrarchaeobius halalkaliphilus TaxID=1679091 RepID=A0A3N6MA23_9EURY|nr:KEOPS complex subunit Cgi121 [Natrarchaeobius halalkaliphilus]RQG93170.1 KEOPS complex component [Natrarchaeobius halalkaliphilus]
MRTLECRLAIDDLDGFVAALGDIGDRTGTTVQAFDARYVADRRHLKRALELADRSIARGENVARDRAVEILLYAAGRRQIDRALEMGIGERETRAVVLVDRRPDGGDCSRADTDDGNGIGGTDVSDAESEAVDAESEAVDAIRDLEAFVGEEPTLDSPDETTLCAFFDVTDAEREATDASLGALVRERVALLEVEK